MLSKKLLAVAFLIVMPLVFNLLAAPYAGAYSYGLAKAGASAEEIAVYEGLALGVALIFGIPGLIFAGVYGAINIA